VTKEVCYSTPAVRRTFRCGLRQAIGVLGLWCVATSSAYAQQWEPTYREALAAFAKQDWTAAENKLIDSKALAAKAGRSPGRRVLVTGSFRTTFIPDYYLGRLYLARAEQANGEARKALLDRARSALATARSTDQVRDNDPEAPTLKTAVETIARLELVDEPPGGGPTPPGRGSTPPVDPLDPARANIRRALEEGTAELDRQNWASAQTSLQQANQILQTAPALGADFSTTLTGLLNDTGAAVDVEQGLRQLRNGAFSQAVAPFTRAGGVKPSHPAVQQFVAPLPALLAEARLGQTLLEADTAMRESRWTAAMAAYESATRDGASMAFVSPRAKELYAQAPAQLRQVRLQQALAERRFADALGIDSSNRQAREGQYGLMLAAFKGERWDEADAAIASLRALKPPYLDVADRDAVVGMQRALAAGILALEQRTPGSGARQQLEQVIELQKAIRGPLMNAPVVTQAATAAQARLNQMDSDAALQAANAFFRKGDFDQARATAKLALEKVDGRQDALDLLRQMDTPGLESRTAQLLETARQALQRGDLAEAESSARALDAIVKGYEPAGVVLDEIASIRAARNRRYLFGASAGLLAIGPLLLVSPRRRGRFLAFMGRPAPALRLYERVLARDPGDSVTLSRAAALAVTYKLASTLETHFDAYLRAKPDDAGVAMAAADYFWNAGREARAADIYEKILASAGHTLPPEAYDRLGRCHANGLTPQLTSLLERTRAGDSANAGLIRLLAREHARADRSDAEALAVYRAASEQQPQDGELRLLLARALLEHGELQEAANEAERAARLRGDDTAALDVLVESYRRAYAGAPADALIDLSSRRLPATAVLIVGEKLAAGAPSLRETLSGMYRKQQPAGEEASARLLFDVHHALDTGDLDATRRQLDLASEAPPRSPLFLRALIQAHERYLEAVEKSGRPPDSERLARMAGLHAGGGWWLDAVTTWQAIVSVPEWNRRSMAAIQDLLDRRSLVDIAQAYFGTAGWNVDDVTGNPRDGISECLVSPGWDVATDIATGFHRTQVFCCTEVVTVDDVVRLKRRVLDSTPADGAVAFLLTGQAVRHDVYALIYAFMTEEPAVTLVPLEAQSVRDAIVEARSRHHLERTLHQWLGHTDVYETHNPVSNAATFFGRGHFINELVLKISRGENFGIFGLRKIGKTSLVYRLRELSRDHLVAYVDLQGVASRHVSEVYIRLIESLIRDMRIKHPDVPPPALRASADRRAEVAVDFHADILAIRRAFEASSHPLPHVLLLLDEIELMIPERGSPGFEGHQDFLRHVRGLHQQERFIVSAVVGASPTICRTPRWDGRDNPVFQFYDEVFLVPLDRAECDQMVQGLGEVMGVRFDAASLQRVYEETAGHPYVARQVCSRLVKAYTERPLEVRADMVGVAIDDYLAQRGDYFAGVLESYLDTTSRRIVETIATQDEGGADRARILLQIESTGEKRHLADQALGDLELTGLARRTGDRYALGIPLFRRWLRRSWLGLE
jgi:predicted Zn-dependent protease